MYLKRRRKTTNIFRNKQEKIFLKESKLKHGPADSNGLLHPG